MSRTDLDPTTLAASLRRMAGDGSVEWVTEPMQTRVLLDVADMLDENAKLRELLLDVADVLGESAKLRELAKWLRRAALDGADNARDVLTENAKLRKLLLDVWNDAMQFDGFWDYVNDDGEIYNEDELPHYYDRMRELGVEVRGSDE